MDGQPTWTDCDEAGDYVVPNVLSPRDLVSRPDIMDETVPHIKKPLWRTRKTLIFFNNQNGTDKIKIKVSFDFYRVFDIPRLNFSVRLYFKNDLGMPLIEQVRYIK